MPNFDRYRRPFRCHVSLRGDRTNNQVLSLPSPIVHSTDRSIPQFQSVTYAGTVLCAYMLPYFHLSSLPLEICKAIMSATLGCSVASLSLERMHISQYTALKDSQSIAVSRYTTAGAQSAKHDRIAISRQLFELVKCD